MLLNFSHRCSVAGTNEDITLSSSQWDKLRTIAIRFCAPSLGFSVDLLGFFVNINCCFGLEKGCSALLFWAGKSW